MLPKKNRLNRKEVKELKARKNKILQGEFFGLIFESAPEENILRSDSKFGVIISNSISKKATKRNKIKRRLFQTIEKKFFTKNGKFLFLAKRKCLEAGPAKLEEEIVKFDKLIQ